MIRRVLPRLGDFLFVSIFAGALLLGQRMLNVDSDVGRHLTLGGYMLESRSIPVRDVLSFTRAGAPRPPYEWSAQVVFALANRLLGLDGVVLVTSCIIASAFLVVFLDGRERTDSPLLTLITAVWAATASSLHWLTRPHIFTFLFLAIWLCLLERLRLGNRRAIWQLPLVMLAWANTHGGFVAGFLAWAAYLLGSAADQGRSQSSHGTVVNLALAGGFSTAASVLTPGLWGSWEAVLRNSSPYLLARTGETMPLDFAAFGSWPFLGLLAAVVLLALLNRRRIASAHAFLLMGFGALALLMVRNVPLFSLAAVPIAAAWARRVLSTWSAADRIENSILQIESGFRCFLWPLAAVVLVTVSMVIQALAHSPKRFGFHPAVFPVEASTWVEHQSIHGNMFNDLNWGGYLLYRLWPERRVFIDSQSDFYGEQFIREYAAVLAGANGWEADLDQHEIAWVIIPPRSPLADQMRESSGWHLAYEDPTAVIFVRNQT